MFKRILTKKKTICILSGILLILIVWTAWGNTALELNTYTISSRGLPDAFDGYRIAQVSDLHNAEFGDGNQRLLNMLREAEPDMIAITGDLIDSRKTNMVSARMRRQKKITLENFSFCFSGAFNAASFVKQIKAFVPEGQLLRVSVAVEVVEPEPSATEPATEESP